MNLPNKITLSRIALIPLMMICLLPLPDFIQQMESLYWLNNIISMYGNYIGAFIFIIASITDGVDGYIARKHNIVTNLGIFLDPIADKLMVSAALIALTEQGVVSGWITLIIISREFIVTGFRLIASGESLVISANNWGKIKTITQMLAIIMLLTDNIILGKYAYVPVGQVLIYIATAITIYSAAKYIYDNRFIINKK